MKAISYLPCFWLFLEAATPAFGLAGRLTQPDLAFPERFPESARTPILAALRRPDGTFLGGHFIQWFTTLRYGGPTSALNRFLEGLAKCPGVTLSICFQNDRIPETCDWLVFHEAGEPAKITVRVNLHSSQIDLGDLKIPEIQGPGLSEAR